MNDRVIKLGNCYIGVSNNWRRLHGFPMLKTKRYVHESKKVPKMFRVKYHRMKIAGCSIELIHRYIPEWY